jgi:hypothetical protein
MRRASQDNQPADVAPPDGGRALNQVRAESESLLAVAEDALRRVRSTNSETFLRQGRQTGGQ